MHIAHRKPTITLAALTGAMLLAGCGSKGGGTVAPLGNPAATTTAAGASASSNPTGTTAMSAPSTSTTEVTAPPSGSGGADTTADPTAGAGTSPVTSTVAAVTDRSLTYRQFTVTIDGAVISRVRPEDFEKPSTAELAETPYLYVKGHVKNNLSFSSDLVSYEEVRLAPASGDPIFVGPRVGTVLDLVQNGATNRGWWAFEIPAGFTIEGSSLLFGHPGEEVEKLPLTGTPPAPRWPVAASVASPGTVTMMNADAPFTVKVTIDRAQLSTSFAFDADRTGFASEHALTGRRKLLVDFTASLVTVAFPGRTSETWTWEAARLVIDGERQSVFPEFSDSTNLELGSPYHGRYVFDIPASGKVQLAWGDITKPVVVDVPVQ